MSIGFKRKSTSSAHFAPDPRLGVQLELSSVARDARESLDSLNASPEYIVDFIEARKEPVREKLRKSREALSGKLFSSDLSKESPSSKIGNFEYLLRVDGPDKFFAMFAWEVDTFLGRFFPSKSWRWGERDIQEARSAAKGLACICGAIVDPGCGMRGDLTGLYMSLVMMSNKLESCDYINESQRMQLELAELQLRLAQEQEAVAKRSEFLNKCMVLMTLVVTIATIVSSVLAFCSYRASLEKPNGESVGRIEKRVTTLENSETMMGRP